MIFFFYITIKYIKKNKDLVNLTLLNHRIKRCGWLTFVLK